MRVPSSVNKSRPRYADSGPKERTRPVLRLFVALLMAMPLHALADDSSQESDRQFSEEVTARLDAIKAAATGRVRIVDCNKSFGYDEIQRAIVSSSAGDVVVVLPRNHMGIKCEGDAYVERIDFRGRAITVQSLVPDDLATVDKTIIDGAQKGCVVLFNDNEIRDTVLNGLTIRNGSNHNGGGILCWEGCPTIRNCVITGNTAKDHGGGIKFGSETNAVIHNCRITNNTAAHGAGIASASGLLTISNCLIAGNRAIESGGGVKIEVEREQEATIRNCTIAGNTAGWRGGGVKSWCEGTLIVDECVVWGNKATKGQALDIWADGKLTVTRSDVQGGLAGVSFQPSRGEPPPWSSDNIDVDPKFVNPSAGDYGLAGSSPCITRLGTSRRAMGYVHDPGIEFLESLPPPTGCSRDSDSGSLFLVLERMSERRDAELLVFLESFQFDKAPPGILQTFHSSVLGFELVYAANWQPFMGGRMNPVRKMEPRTWEERMRQPVHPLDALHQAPEVEWKVTVYRIYDGTMADYVQEHALAGVVDEFEFAPGLIGKRISEGASPERVMEWTAVDYVVVRDRRAIQIHAEFPVRTSHLLLPYFDQVAHSLKMFEPFDDRPRERPWKKYPGAGYTLEYPGDWIRTNPCFDDRDMRSGGRPMQLFPAEYFEPGPDSQVDNVASCSMYISTRVTTESHKKRLKSLPYVNKSEPFDVSPHGPGVKSQIGDRSGHGFRFGVPLSHGRFLSLSCHCTGDLEEWKDVFERIGQSLVIE